MAPQHITITFLWHTCIATHYGALWSIVSEKMVHVQYLVHYSVLSAQSFEWAALKLKSKEKKSTPLRWSSLHTPKGLTLVYAWGTSKKDFKGLFTLALARGGTDRCSEGNTVTSWMAVFFFLSLAFGLWLQHGPIHLNRLCLVVVLPFIFF